jgi:hypothetical protein
MLESLPMVVLAATAGMMALVTFGALRWIGLRPAAAFLLLAYLPFQNILLPVLLRVGGVAAMAPLLPAKEILAIVGILESLRPAFANYRLRVADVLAVVFATFLIVNAAFSPADLTSVGHGLRDFSVPLLMYLLGRVAWYGGTANTPRLMRLVLIMGVIVAVLGLVDYGLAFLNLSPFDALQAGYFDVAYGHGAPAAAHQSEGFMGVSTLTGQFGNNLITATYLRFTLCTLLAYLSYSAQKARRVHLIILALLVVASIFTFSRYGLAFLLVLGVTLLGASRSFLRWQKILTAVVLLAVIGTSAPTLARIATTTAAVGDQSTYTHMESLRELKNIDVSIMGNGLGTGAHSSQARLIYRDSEGEGILRQDIPEIGVLGVGLLLAFATVVIGGLTRNATLGLPTRRWHYVWIAVPLLAEVIVAPFDIGLRSFLGTGSAWFLCGWFLSEGPSVPNQTRRPFRSARIHGRSREGASSKPRAEQIADILQNA